MKNCRPLFAFALVALLALAGFTFRADSQEAAARQWEYEILTLPVTADKADVKPLNFDGRQGWELVAVERSGQSRTYFLKRQK